MSRTPEEWEAQRDLFIQIRAAMYSVQDMADRADDIRFDLSDDLAMLDLMVGRAIGQLHFIIGKLTRREDP